MITTLKYSILCSYGIPLNPYGRGGATGGSMKDTMAREDYPPHIPVVKPKHMSEKDDHPVSQGS